MQYDELRKSRQIAYFDKQLETYKHNPALVDLIIFVKHELESKKVATL